MAVSRETRRTDANPGRDDIKRLGEEMDKTEVIKRIGANRWGAFTKFMVGQTVRVGMKGEVYYYEQDVENFINKMNGKQTFFD